MGVRILFLSVVVLILFLRNSSSQSCHDDNGLEQQMSKEGYSGCPWVNHMYVRGFKKKSSPNDLRGFKAAKCCVPSSVYLWKPNVCTSADWDLSFRKEGWATCPSGHFLLGFHRGGSNQLRSIQWTTCCKPSVHPHRYKECYDQNVGSGDTWECNKRYHYVVGIHRGASESLSSINRLRCCSMYDQVLPLKGLDDVKTRIMDVTLRKLALLAHYLGYGWVAGCRGRVVGEDFIRDGDRWKAVYRSGCSGYKSLQRLKIAYENFSFRVKKMDYMKPEIKSIKPIVQDTGEIKNQDSLPTTTNVRRQIKSVRTVTDSSTERFKTTIGASDA